MDAESRSMRMLLQALPRRAFVAVFVTFVVLLAAAVVVGFFGPDVYDTYAVSSNDCPPGLESYSPACFGVNIFAPPLALPTATATADTRTAPPPAPAPTAGPAPGVPFAALIRRLSPLNGELLVHLRVQRSAAATAADAPTVEFTLVLNVTLEGRNADEALWSSLESGESHNRTLRCAVGREECTTVFGTRVTLAHVPFLEFEEYQLAVQVLNTDDAMRAAFGDALLEFEFVDDAYTMFELWARFAFILLAFGVTVFFFHALRLHHWADWTVEQKWTAVLLFALFAYNNPLYPLEVLVRGWFPIFLNRLLLATCLGLLLLFWLVMFDGIRKEDIAAERRFLRFYAPKFALVGLLWGIMTGIFVWWEVFVVSDPASTPLQSHPVFVVLAIVELVLLLAYAFWLLYAICRACGDRKMLPFLGTRLKFFGVFSLFVAVLTLGNIIFNIQRPLNSAAQFVSFLALYNLYLWVLAFMYSPSRWGSSADAFSSARLERIGMVRLEEEDSDSAFSDRMVGERADDSLDDARARAAVTESSDDDDDDGGAAAAAAAAALASSDDDDDVGRAVELDDIKAV